ncbi:HET-domain-containing protein [Hypoxylon sp. EC38]|nr:HET-domain-containing protein [Hypoxylon sp. EC38]
MEQESCRAQNDGYRRTLTSRFANPPNRRYAQNIAIPPTYKYRPLRNPKGYIRLLYLFPQSCSAGLQERSVLPCVILTYQISKAPPYTGLSYTWGDTTLCRKIDVGGRLLHITENLAVALEYLQEEKRTLVLWVDAVCINQTDELEKGAQVQMMGKIFMHASVVIAWLGPPKDGSDEIMQWRKRNLRSMRQSPPPLFNLGPSEGKRHISEAVTAFLERPWFNRVWVMQEVALNNNVVFVCGKKDSDKITLLHYISFAAAVLNCITYQYISVHATRFETRKPSSLKIYLTRLQNIDSLSSHIDLHSSEPKDFVYSYLGMISDSEKYQLRADYTKTVEDVYTDFTVAIIRAGKLRSVAGLIRPSLRYPKLPSWVPDWSVTRKYSRGFDRYKIPSSKAEVWLTNKGDRLIRISALRIDSIESVECIHLINDHSTSTLSENLCKFLVKLRTTLSRYSVADDKEINQIISNMSVEVSGAQWNKSTSIVKELYDSYLAACGISETIIDPETSQAEKSRRDLLPLEGTEIQHIFVTRRRNVGLTCSSALPGDFLAALGDLGRLWILREVNPGRYRIISSASMAFHPYEIEMSRQAEVIEIL